MNISVHKNPWPYLLIDDFYDEELLKNSSSELLSFLKVKSDLTNHMCLYSQDTNSSLPQVVYDVFGTVTLSMLTALLKYFPTHRSYKTLGIEQTVNILLGDYEYPLHCDHERKILTAVTYLYPNHSIGTQLYDKNKEYVSTIPWIPYKTFLFAPITDFTWHSYKTSNNKIRITLNTSLISI